jgi:hypothetical protein
VLPPSDNSTAVNNNNNDDDDDNNNNNNNNLKTLLAYLTKLLQLHFFWMIVPICPLPVRTALF